MNSIRKLRPLLLLCALLVALAPFGAYAKDTSTGHQQSEIDNAAARCGLVLAGAKVPGKLTKAQCSAFAAGFTAGVEVRALGTLPSDLALTDHQRAELANEAARCALVLAGQKISGNLRADQCKVFATTKGGEVRALATLPETAHCPVAKGASLSRVQMDMLNAFAIAKAKAEHKNLPEPSPSADVAALLACG